MFQRGSKNVNKNFATKRKHISLKRQSKSNIFSEHSSAQSTDKKDTATISLPSKNGRSNSTSTILHPLNKCGLSSNNSIGLLKKQGKTKLPGDMQKNKNLSLKKMYGFKMENDLLQNKTEFLGRSSNKRKIEKKLNPTGNATASARPPNKKRKKSTIM